MASIPCVNAGCPRRAWFAVGLNGQEFGMCYAHAHDLESRADYFDGEIESTRPLTSADHERGHFLAASRGTT